MVWQSGPAQDRGDPETSLNGSPRALRKRPFGYGRHITPELPQQLRLYPKISGEPEDGQRQVSDDSDMSHHHSSLASVSPVRSPLARHATPDQQLLRSLEQSVSPSPRKRRAGLEQDPSTATPSPPVQHTISSTSTPSAPVMASREEDDSEYTSQRSHHLNSSSLHPVNRRGLRSSSISNSTAGDDNESTISWGVERRIHEGEIQRTSSPRYKQEPKGRNITAPPRRLSGLTFHNDTADEKYDAGSPVRSAPSRTVPLRDIYDPFAKDDLYTPNDPADSLTGSTLRSSIPFWKRMGEKTSMAFALTIALVAVISYVFNAQLLSIAQSIASIPFTTYPPHSNFDNSSNGEAVNYLAGEVDSLVRRLSSMSEDMSSLRSSTGKGIDSPTAVRPAEPEVTPQVNFLSLGTGLSIDPRLTSPTVGKRPSLLRKLYSYVTWRQPTTQNSPMAALLPWDDIGDCWCSALRRDGSSQIAIQLGGLFVPEAIVVEHIPKSASLDPGVTPREMELWAQYWPGSASSASTVADTTPSPQKSSPSFLKRFFFHSSSPPYTTHDIPQTSDPQPSPPTLASIFDTLQLTYPHEAEISYWNDPVLGPSFFRIGRWQYDQNGPSIQRFGFDAIINIPGVRVDKVVIRVKSNWGGPHTCLYRLRMYGHL